MRNSSKSVTELYQALRPLILRDVASASGSLAVGGMEAHALSGPWHTGTLLESQAPWAATKAEVTALTTDGSLAVHIAATAAHGATGAVVGTTNTQTLSNKTLTTPTISGTGWTNAQHAHAGATSGGQISHANLSGIGANDHHAQSHVLATNAALGGDHTISGATAGHVLRASSATAAAFAQLQHADLGGVSANQHHNQVHGITGSDHTITANALQVVGATATNTLGLLTPSSSPGAAAAILASNASGLLTLVNLAVSNALIIASTPRRYYEVAQYNSSANPEIGTLKIALPKLGSATMMRIQIIGYQFSATYGRYAWECIVGGYNPNSTTFAYSSVETRGEPPFTQVRLADDGVSNCILLGDLTTRWYYPKIVVQYVLAGHNNTSGWEADWSMSVISDETGITIRSTPTVYHAPPDYRTLTAGNGLTADSGGDLTANRTFAVGAGNGITVNANDVSLTTPGTLTASTTNSSAGSHTHAVTTAAAVTLTVASTNTTGAAAALARADHTHAITASADPGAATALLKSDATGKLTLPLLVATASVSTPSLISAAAAELSIASGADTVLNPTGVVKLASGKLVRSSTFTSGFAGSGWQIDDGIITAGKISAEFDDLTIRGRLRVYELLIQQIRATNGSVFVSSTGKAKTVTGGPSSYTITTDSADNHGFLAGDLIRAQRFTGSGVYQCDLQVTSVTNTYTFVATKIAGDAPASGMEFVRLGSASDASRRGSIYLTADDSGAPFIDVVDGIDSHAAWNSRTADAGVKVRVGRITGITGTANEYGLWAGTGTGNTAQSLVASSAGVTLNNVPLSFKAGSSTVVMQLSPGAGNAVPSFAMGATLPTGPLVGDGLWMGKDSADYEFRVGTVSGGALVKGLHWDGAALNVRGGLIVGPGGGFTVANAILHLKFDAPRYAPWQVNTNGHLGQTCTLVGNIIGEAGKFGGALRLRPAGTNYIDNPSFETDTSYWTIYNGATYTRVTTDSVYGSACASITTGSTANPYLYRANLNDGPALAAGQTWTFSCYVKAGNSGAIGKAVSVRLRENGTLQNTTNSTVTGEWQRIVVQRTLTEATVTSLNHYIYFTSAADSGDIFLVDGIQLEQSSYASPYIDSTMGGVTLTTTNHVQGAHSRIGFPGKANVPTTGTVMAWIKPVNTGGSYVTFVRHIGSSGNFIIRAQPSSNGWQVYWGVNALTKSSVVSWDEWQHVAMTRSDDTTRLYVNGAQQATVGGSGITPSASNELLFGFTSDPGCGLIDDFVLTGDILTADDIRQVYESGLPVTCPTTPFEFELSDGTLASITGHSGGLFAVDADGNESFALANGAKAWGTRYSGGSALASGDLVLGDPDQFHLMYDASAASLLIGKATEEHIAISSTSLQVLYNTTAYVTIDSSGATFTGSVTASSGSITGAFDVGAALQIATGGSIYSGAASTWQSAGYQLQYNAGTPRLYVGDGGVTSGDKYLMWDGTNIEWRGVNTSLTAAGLFTATNASIAGAIDANSGTIGALTVDGALTIGSGGSLAAGATSYAAGTGIWLEYNAGTPRLRIGTTAGNRLTWDGTTLTIAGNGAGVTSISGSNITTGTIDADKLNVSTLSTIAADMGSITAGSIVIGTTNKIWLNDSADGALSIGGVVKASAPFRVSAAGALTATGATVSGTINSTDGNIGGWTLGVSTLTGGDAVLSNTGYLRMGSASADRFWASAVHSTHRLWIGSDTASSAPFRVTKAGALTATGVNVTGAITAESGSIAGVLSVDAAGEIRQGSGTWLIDFTGLRIWSDGGVGRIAGYSSSTAQWWASTDGTLRAGGGNVRLNAAGVSMLLPAIAGAFSESELTTNAAAMRWLPSLSSTWTSASDLSAIYAYRETTYDSNDVALVSRVGSSAYTTRTARVMLQPMLWTGSIFKQANLIASLNNTDSQLTWDGTKFVLSAGHMEYSEITAPAAPAANKVVVFARDNGSGKTQLCARFATGAIQILATEP